MGLTEVGYVVVVVVVLLGGMGVKYSYIFACLTGLGQPCTMTVAEAKK